ncbi:NADH-quinone oxidoreductase subunit NuoE [Geobacter pickeringii]|uniref:NADH dehydrogenase n=1 Tax=Geobacter pickeringii TaxID=345632 RepID=A0A0B5B6A0_9BACT|nr:NADH-quinone oxidoreductase subunit NuoE [Geobacter pickeringii]AJE02053.1 NADH dehydrogenase [Geobacter pickeringii]
MLPDSLKSELKARVAHAVTNREAVVDVMKELQRHYGWLTDEAVAEAAELLGLTPLQVEELATFYEMIYRRPVGKRVIHVCDSISCWAMGGESLMAHLARQLGIGPGETTADGMFTLLPCCCLGNCGEAPTLMIGDTLHGRVTPEQASEIVEKERSAAR